MKFYQFIKPMLISSVFITAQVLAKKDHSAKFTQTEKIHEAVQFDTNHENNHFTVFNVYGSIDVESYAGSEIVIDAVNSVYANSQTLVDDGIDEIGLKIEKHGHRIYAYLDSPYSYIDHEENKVRHSNTCWRHDDCSRKHPKRKDYRYHMDIKVKIPEHSNIHIDVVAINDGNIKIKGITAKSLNVENINGAIDMTDVAGQTQVNAINKDINITYRKNPVADSSYESINGDLNISFAGQLNAYVVYQTMHGELYSAYDVSMMAPEVQRTSMQKKHGIQYKLGAESRLKVGSGGPEYRFKTLNGDIKIQRQ